jgi:TonB family protein
MRKRCAGTVISLCFSGIVASCVTHEAARPVGAPSPTGSAKGVDPILADGTRTATLRKLPRAHFDMRNDPYPEQGKRQHLEGRVLVEFQLDPSGKAVSLKVVQAEAAPILEAAALNVVRRTKFDVSSPSFNAADPTPFRVTVRFCLMSCGSITPFPGSEDVAITGSPL